MPASSAEALVPERDFDVEAWLRGRGLERYVEAFRGAELTREVGPELTDADLRELGLPLGPRKVVLKAMRELAASPAPEAGPARSGTPSGGSPVPATAAERRQVTAMFADLVGSTALAARLDPEEMGAVLAAYHRAVAAQVQRLEGHVAKLLGDGVPAYSGWRRAHEDERAVRAGLAIVEAVPRLATPAGTPPAARVGIASGPVVVGELAGEGAAREGAVDGETPYPAVRLQEAAGPGTVAIAEGTRRLLGQVFELRELGAVPLKGFERPLRCFQAVGERPAESRFEARQPDGASPMVGRDQELAVVPERWRQARVGEAGIGKSRLGCSGAGRTGSRRWAGTRA
jgi:class 3 adenylate cyclase